MSLGNTPTRETTIAVERAKSFAFGIRFLNKNGEPVDVSTATVRMVVSSATYDGGREILNLDATHVIDNDSYVQFEMQAADLDVAPGSYPYDVTLIPDSGYSSPLLKGYLEIGSNTDLDSSNTYSDIAFGSDVTAVLGEGQLVEVTIDSVQGLNFPLWKGTLAEFNIIEPKNPNTLYLIVETV